MFRRLILMVVVLGFFTTLFGEVNPDTLPEKYTKKVIIKAKWGSGEGEIGYDPSGPGFGSEGFAVDANGDIYILDDIHGSVKKYNIEGKMLAEYKHEAFNSGHGIVVDKQGNIYVFTEDSHNNVDMREILKYSPQNKSTESFWFPEADPSYGVRTIGNRMIVEKNGDIIFDSKSFEQKQTKSLMPSDVEYIDLKDKDYRNIRREGRALIGIKRFATKSTILTVEIPYKFNESYYPVFRIYFLGKDAQDCMYFCALYSMINPPEGVYAGRIKYVVYKYDPSGNLLAMVVVPDDEVNYLGLIPENRIRVDTEGNVYAMCPCKNDLKIYKFTQQ